MRPARRIVELASAGRLESLEPFAMPASTARTIGSKYVRRLQTRERAADLLRSDDPVEQLRRRLLVAIDHELGRVESLQRGRSAAPRAQELREIARAARELGSLPAPAATNLAGAANGAGANRPSSAKVGGMAAALVRADRSLDASALEPAPEPDGQDRLNAARSGAPTTPSEDLGAQ